MLPNCIFSILTAYDVIDYMNHSMNKNKKYLFRQRHCLLSFAIIYITVNVLRVGMMGVYFIPYIGQWEMQIIYCALDFLQQITPLMFFQIPQMFVNIYERKCYEDIQSTPSAPKTS